MKNIATSISDQTNVVADYSKSPARQVEKHLEAIMQIAGKLDDAVFSALYDQVCAISDLRRYMITEPALRND